MQKKSLFLFLFIFAILWLFSVMSFSLEREYDYAQSIEKINIISGESQLIHTKYSWNSWVFAISRDEENIPEKIIWNVDGKNYVRTFDREDADDTQFLYTFPLVTDVRDTISVQLIWWWGGVFGWHILLENTESYKNKVVFVPFSVFADSNVHVVSRKEWWADESIRYRDQNLVEQKISDWESRGRTPRIVELTEADVFAQKKDEKIGKILWDLHPESFSLVKKVRYENGRKLIWPLEYARAVDRIVVHHTAETIDQASSDPKSVMRAMYAYHARTRGWGDIWYNYVVWKDGTIYEWRAGWDYVQGAHAYANNLWTVWVSLMGNFEIEALSSIQRDALENLLVYLAKKYGINVEEDTTGFRVCSKDASSDCVIETRNIKRLHGHRDVWYTSCPGKNLYSELDNIRRYVSSKVWKVRIVYNKNTWSIDPVPPEDMVKFMYPSHSSLTGSVASESIPKTNITSVNPSLWGKKIKIKLSYPETKNIELSLASSGSAQTKIWWKKFAWDTYKNIKVWIVWNNKLTVKVWDRTYTGSTIEYIWSVIRIDSWERIPAWDTTKKYNDNLFRSKIIIRNYRWKLLVINELPLEDYIRWLGEVSNGDNPEKIKTILVAARSYARYYMSPTHRKYNTRLYDWSDDPDSFQKYLWYSYEMRSPNVSRETSNTLGQVIIYKWDIIKAWYFSTSNGRTLSYREYCEKNSGKKCDDVPYLQSVSDPAGEWKNQLWHGVWISGVWATTMAESGKTYKEIIQYYMKWVAIERK